MYSHEITSVYLRKSPFWYEICFFKIIWILLVNLVCMASVWLTNVYERLGHLRSLKIIFMSLFFRFFSQLLKSHRARSEREWQEFDSFFPDSWKRPLCSRNIYLYIGLQIIQVCDAVPVAQCFPVGGYYVSFSFKLRSWNLHWFKKRLFTRFSTCIQPYEFRFQNMWLIRIVVIDNPVINSTR